MLNADTAINILFINSTRCVEPSRRAVLSRTDVDRPVADVFYLLPRADANDVRGSVPRRPGKVMLAARRQESTLLTLLRKCRMCFERNTRLRVETMSV